MSSGRSIDGLKRRGSSPVKRTSASRRVHPVMKAPIRDATPTRRKIGVSEKEKTDDQIGVVNTGGEKKIKEADNAKAVKDFLSENYNDDPTDLVDAPRKKKKEKKKKRGHKGLKRFLIVFVILLIVAGGGIFLYLNDFVSQITDGGGLLGLLLSDPDTPLEKDENGRSNILIFGTEGWSMDHPEQYDGGDLTDSMMLISINQDTGDAKAISLPRDLKTTTCTSSGKLNEVYYCNYSEIYTKIAAGQKVSNEERQEYERKAATELAKKFEEILGIKVHYRVHVNWQAVVQVIDAIGGVDVVFVYGDQKWDGNETAIEVSDERGIADMRYDYSGYNFEYQTGKAYHLGGQEALAVARARNAFGGYGASGGNFSREYFQQRIIEAMVKKARASQITSDLVKALKIKEAVGKNFRTNFKDTEIKTLLKLADSDILTRMETISLYNADEGGQSLLTMGMINGISYVYPAEGVGQYSQIHSYIKKQLSGADYINEGAKIVVLNGTKANGVAGNEKNDLEDDGYTVSQVDNAPDKDGLSNFDGVKLYQVNTKMEKTAKALKKRYGVDIITKIPNELKSYDSDFIVIIGNGHKN
ncbi:LCP family protein [Candidatus Saccharibacteria bacterium]|nr:LCP family protein [Candidatus Saccharibacteria bacterium]